MRIFLCEVTVKIVERLVGFVWGEIYRLDMLETFMREKIFWYIGNPE